MFLGRQDNPEQCISFQPPLRWPAPAGIEKGPPGWAYPTGPDLSFVRLLQVHLRAARKASHAGHPFTFNSERGDNAILGHAGSA